MIGFAGEGLTDFKVTKNLLIGFFNDKNLSITRFLPKNTEPVGWGNLLNYLSTEEFRNGVENVDWLVVQIDTDKCEEWNMGFTHIGDDVANINNFVLQIKNALINKIGLEFYNANIEKFLFAICVHDIECWLLPYNAQQQAHYSKIVSCVKTTERICIARGFSINEKNYENGKHYEVLSRDMKKQKKLMAKYQLNPSLKIFVDTLLERFPQNENEMNNLEEPQESQDDTVEPPPN